MSGATKVDSPPFNAVTALNDAFRRSFANGHVVLTDGVAALPEIERIAVLRAVQAFDAFTADNDPYGEHDFGALEQAGTRYFWKIDYYEPDLRYGSPDPANPAVTRRVLTVMRADEY